MQGIDLKKPFHHPAIINTLREAFFKRKRGPSIAQKHQSLFCTSLDMGVAVREVELPPAMVAMAAVAASTSTGPFMLCSQHPSGSCITRREGY